MSIRSRVAAVLLAAPALVAVTLTTAQPASAAGTYVTIKSYASGLCLGIAPADDWYNGALVRQNYCDHSLEQLWQRVPLSNGGWYLVNQANGKCMDVQDGRNADRTPVQLWDCTAYKGMYWHFQADVDGPIISEIGPRCLDDPIGSIQPGQTMQTYHCTAKNPAQMFRVS